MILYLLRLIFGDLRCLLQLDRTERQGLMQLALILGLIMETAVGAAIFLYNQHIITLYHQRSMLAAETMPLLISLMKIQLGAIAFIAIGDIASARIGEWFEIRRQENGNAQPNE